MYIVLWLIIIIFNIALMLMFEGTRPVIAFDDANALIDVDGLARQGGRQAFRLIASFCNTVCESGTALCCMAGSDLEMLQALIGML